MFHLLLVPLLQCGVDSLQISWHWANYEGLMVYRERIPLHSRNDATLVKQIGGLVVNWGLPWLWERTHKHKYIPSTPRVVVRDCQLRQQPRVSFSQRFKERHVIGSSLIDDKIFWYITRGVCVRKTWSPLVVLVGFHFMIYLLLFAFTWMSSNRTHLWKLSKHKSKLLRLMDNMSTWIQVSDRSKYLMPDIS